MEGVARGKKEILTEKQKTPIFCTLLSTKTKEDRDDRNGNRSSKASGTGHP
jgi:hypothetical protein